VSPDPLPGRLRDWFINKEGWKTQSEADILHALGEISEYGDVEATRSVAHYLRSGHFVPEARYAKAIASVSTSVNGSASDILQLLKDISSEYKLIDHGVPDAILKALAVHPDFLLRAQVLAVLEREWRPLTAGQYQWVIAGLLRDGQYERALEALDSQVASGSEFANWLFDLAAYALLQVNEFEEALRIVQIRMKVNDINDMTCLWTHFLDTAAESYHVGFYMLKTAKVANLNLVHYLPIHMATKRSPRRHQSKFRHLFQRPRDFQQSRRRGFRPTSI
jgi:tetratricopeptide (TPR) repeat protein